MYIDFGMVEKTSEHYYVPLPTQLQDVLYYPVSVGYFDCKPNYHLQRNSFSSYLLILMLSGSLSFQTRRHSGVARAGQALVLDCNAPHSYAAQGRCSFMFVHFDGAQSKAIYEAIEQRFGCLVQVERIMPLHEAIADLINSMRQEKRASEARTASLLYSVLMHLLEQSGSTGEGSTGNTMVDRAIAYIEEHLAERLTVEGIAASIGYSPSYFAHIFADETGMSPYQFVVRSRLERARMLLQSTRISIQDIAFQTGFNSVANFCYAFRRDVGVSPQQYRNTIAKV